MKWEEIKTIAIVGISNNPERASYQVGRYLKNEGFTIIPINPNITEFMGQKSYNTISDIPQEIAIDVVDIFRKSDEVLNIIQEIIASKRKPIIWMQEGVYSEEAIKLAESLGMEVFANMCLMKAHMK